MEDWMMLPFQIPVFSRQPFKYEAWQPTTTVLRKTISLASLQCKNFWSMSISYRSQLQTSDALKKHEDVSLMLHICCPLFHNEPLSIFSFFAGFVVGLVFFFFLVQWEVKYTKEINQSQQSSSICRSAELMHSLHARIPFSTMLSILAARKQSSHILYTYTFNKYLWHFSNIMEG